MIAILSIVYKYTQELQKARRFPPLPSKVTCDMVPLKLDHYGAPHHHTALTANESEYLNTLRFVAMSCRVKPRADLFEACALLHVPRRASRDAHTDALMRCLREALGKPARLHSPGSDELTFDEKWLLQLGRATAHGDDGSTAFLLASRVSSEHRRLIGFLVARIAEYFSLI
ncbi:MAG: hypothetical protein AAF252_04780 [Pseudomonadota bacterium]